MSRYLLALLLLGASLLAPLRAEEARIAVAANFAEPLRAAAEQLTKETGHQFKISAGSTGKLYAQIRQGAPFDAFFAADTERPELLEKAGAIVKGSRFTYARGMLVLWSPQENFVDAKGEVLWSGQFRKLALPNPRLAPYGKATQGMLEALGLWKGLQGKVVFGENVSQAYHFIATGNAELGFVAASQVFAPGKETKGSFWKPDAKLYHTIEQQAVRLSENQAATVLLEAFQTGQMDPLLKEWGYE